MQTVDFLARIYKLLDDSQKHVNNNKRSSRTTYSLYGIEARYNYGTWDLANWNSMTAEKSPKGFADQHKFILTQNITNMNQNRCKQTSHVTIT